jgi:cytochrome c oxidase cbb3-type subunit 4
MNIYSIVSIAATVLSFLFFIGIVVWAYSRGRRQAFAEAANAPFAVPDENDPRSGTDANANANANAAERKA